MGSVTPEKHFLPPIKRRTRNMPCQCHLPVSYFLMKAALQIFIILYASYAWDTCLFRISFANYAIQIVRYDIIYMS